MGCGPVPCVALPLLRPCWKNQCIGLPPAWGPWLAYVPLCGLTTSKPIKEAFPVSTKTYHCKTVLSRPILMISNLLALEGSTKLEINQIRGDEVQSDVIAITICQFRILSFYVLSKISGNSDKLAFPIRPRKASPF